MPKQEKLKQEKPSILEASVGFGKVSLTQKALFAKHLEMMLKSGVTITEALEISEDSAEGKFKKIMGGILQSVKAGQTLSDSFARYPKVFSGLFVSVTHAGEASGTLEENMGNIAQQIKKERELISKIKGAMIYPSVVLTAAFVLGAGMSFWILPKIVPLFEGLQIDLPATTRLLIWFSRIMSEHGLIIVVSCILLVVFSSWLLRKKWVRPLTHWVWLKIPVVKKIVMFSNLARFTRTLGTLIKSGLNLDEALRISKDTVVNYYYFRALSYASNRISKGTQLSVNLENFETLFPLMVVKMIGIGEKSGRLDETLLYVAEFYETEVDNATKGLSTAIEPVLLIIIGVVVGFLALSIITPIYNITGGIR